MMRQKVALVVGTRPEMIKLAPVHSALAASTSIEPILISTGQHREMLEQAATVFGLRPTVELKLMRPNQTLAELTARVVGEMSRVLRDLKPAAVLVQGDTTTVLGTTLAAFYERVRVGHVEAGLRTYNLEAPWPEEMNRRLTDPLARWCFAPTEWSRDNLLREQIPPERVFVTGNTVVDALLCVRNQLRERRVESREIARRCGIPDDFRSRFLDHAAAPWILITGHRRESFGQGFERICQAIAELARQHQETGFLYPVHLNPNVQEPVRRLLGQNPRIALVPPAGYEEFIWLMDRCHFLLSDSGGVQEEAPSLGKPVLVMRESTERPEGVAAGTCTLVGTDPARIVNEAGILLTDRSAYDRRALLRNPYGDGDASERIRKILENEIV